MPVSSADEERERPLRRSELDPDPLQQFSRWFEVAVATGMPAPEAVALATSTRDGRPSARMVLLKGHDERGLRFHTNYDSRKGREAAENPRAALLFHWQPLGRQVRVEGDVEHASDGDSERYFRTRSREAQLSAAASPQSRPVASRDELEARVEELRARFDGRDVPRPAGWGALIVVPAVWEFWQHRANRLHDRFRYHRDGPRDWIIERLAP